MYIFGLKSGTASEKLSCVTLKKDPTKYFLMLTELSNSVYT